MCTPATIKEELQNSVVANPVIARNYSLPRRVGSGRVRRAGSLRRRGAESPINGPPLLFRVNPKLLVFEGGARGRRRERAGLQGYGKPA